MRDEHTNLALLAGQHRKSDLMLRKAHGRNSRAHRVSWVGDAAAGEAASLHRHMLEHEVYENSVSHHFAISQWPASDPMVGRLRSSLKISESRSRSLYLGSVSREKVCVRCMGGCTRRKPINGMIEGPSVKIDDGVFPIDYLAAYKGSISPQSVAILGMDGSTSYTYEELNIASDHLAKAIKELIDQQLKARSKYSITLLNPSAEYEPCIGIAIPPCEKSVIMILAIWKLGLSYLPITTDQNPVLRIASIIEATKPILVIGPSKDKTLQGALEQFKLQLTDYEKLFNRVLGEKKEKMDGKTPFTTKERSDLFKIADLCAVYSEAGKNPAYKCWAVFHRFDGEGKVTAIHVRNKTIWVRVHAEWQNFPYKKNEVTGLYTRLDSYEFLGQMLTPLLAGKQIAVMDVHNLFKFLERVQKSKVGRLMVFPDLLRALVTVMELHRVTSQNKIASNPALLVPPFLESVEYWFCTGSAIRRELAINFFLNCPKKAKLVNLYGARECLCFICFEVYSSLKQVKEGNYYDVLAMGRPVLNTRLYILDHDGSIVTHSGLGEVYVAGMGVTKLASHYDQVEENHGGPCTVHNICLPEEESQHRTDEHLKMFRTLFRTTDFGRLVYSDKKKYCKPQVTLEFSGTAESETVIETYRVNCNEIITHLKNHPVVKSCHVMVYRPGTTSKVILAFVVIANPGQSSKHPREELHLYLRQYIPEYMMPTIVVVSGIPVKNFKVDGSQLIERFQRERQLRPIHPHINPQSAKPPRQSNDSSQSNQEEHHQRAKWSQEYKTARIMFRIFYHICGVGEDWTAEHLSWSLAELHIPFTSAPEILKQLRKHGYYIDMKEILELQTAKQVLTKMLEHVPKPFAELIALEMYQEEIIKDSHKSEITDFFLRGNISKYNTRSIAYYVGLRTKDVAALIHGIWPLVVSKPYSILVRNKRTGKIVAALLNCDHFVKMHSEQWQKVVNEHPTKYRLELIDQIDEVMKANGLLTDGHEKNGLQTLFFLSDPTVMTNYEDAVQICDVLFKRMLDLAAENGFFATFSIIFDYVIAHILEEMFNYEAVEYKQVNMLVARDGTRPFFLAPDNVIGTVLYKQIEK